MEDLTHPSIIAEDPNSDRTVSVYGYVRGCNFRPGMKVHIPGAGDFAIEDMTQLADPCPLPEKEKRRLAGKEKLIYSPMGDIGNLVYDGDAMYINIPDHQVPAAHHR